jgi:hypothetical protein
LARRGNNLAGAKIKKKRPDDWHFRHRRRLDSSDGHARHAIRDVVMRARRMVNRVAATTGGSTLKRTQLRDQPRMIEQLTPATVCWKRLCGALTISLRNDDESADEIFPSRQPRRQGSDLSRLSDAELNQQLSDQAKELGIEIDLNYRVAQESDE